MRLRVCSNRRDPQSREFGDAFHELARQGHQVSFTPIFDGPYTVYSTDDNGKVSRSHHGPTAVKYLIDALNGQTTTNP